LSFVCEGPDDASRRIVGCGLWVVGVFHVENYFVILSFLTVS
jgi:hypothetical protein